MVFTISVLHMVWCFTIYSWANVEYFSVLNFCQYHYITVKPLNSPPPPNKGQHLNKGQMTTMQVFFFFYT